MSGYSPPAYNLPASNTLVWGSLEALGVECTVVGPGAGAAGAYLTANLSLWYPFAIATPFVVAQLFWLNGATVSGNVDVGIYDESFTRLVSTGSTGQAGTSNMQVVDITDYVLAPGIYYMALACDNTTSTFVRNNSAAATWASFGALELTSNFALGAGPLSPVTIATAYMPVFGMSSGTVV